MAESQAKMIDATKRLAIPVGKVVAICLTLIGAAYHVGQYVENVGHSITDNTEAIDDLAVSVDERFDELEELIGGHVFISAPGEVAMKEEVYDKAPDVPSR